MYPKMAHFWSTLTLALLCLSILIQFTSGLKCYICNTQCKDGKDGKLIEELNGMKFEGGVCTKTMISTHDGRTIISRGFTYNIVLKKMKEYKGLGCHQLVDTESDDPEYESEELPVPLKQIFCACDTDGCNSGMSFDISRDSSSTNKTSNLGRRFGVIPEIIFGIMLFPLFF